MKINLKIVAQKMRESVIGDVRIEGQEFPHSFGHEPIEWVVSYQSDLAMEDLLGSVEAPSALLLDGRDNALLGRVCHLERQILAFVKNHPQVPLVPSPVIAVLPLAATMREVPDFPDCIADWVYAPLLVQDMAQRVLVSLKRRGYLGARLQFGDITLFPATRQLHFDDRSICLTHSEFLLLEFFLRRSGAVIPLQDLVVFFKSIGKSAEPNNIRVTIFQLRLKLDHLTRSRITLISVYKRGYCLRQNRSRPVADSLSKASPSFSSCA